MDILFEALGHGWFWFGVFVGFFLGLWVASRIAESDKRKGDNSN